jgi:hypothetical protein
VEFLGEGDAEMVQYDEHSCNTSEALLFSFIVKEGTSTHLMSRCLEESIAGDEERTRRTDGCVGRKSGPNFKV